jgi:hypothetical protein
MIDPVLGITQICGTPPKICIKQKADSILGVTCNKGD